MTDDLEVMGVDAFVRERAAERLTRNDLDMVVLLYLKGHIKDGQLPGALRLLDQRPTLVQTYASILRLESTRGITTEYFDGGPHLLSEVMRLSGETIFHYPLHLPINGAHLITELSHEFFLRPSTAPLIINDGRIIHISGEDNFERLIVNRGSFEYHNLNNNIAFFNLGRCEEMNKRLQTSRSLYVDATTNPYSMRYYSTSLQGFSSGMVLLGTRGGSITVTCQALENSEVGGPVIPTTRADHFWSCLDLAVATARSDPESFLAQYGDRPATRLQDDLDQIIATVKPNELMENSVEQKILLPWQVAR